MNLWKGNWEFLVLFLKLFSELKLFQNKKLYTRNSLRTSSLRNSMSAWQSMIIPQIICNRVLYQWDLWDTNGSLMSLLPLCPSSCPSHSMRAAHTEDEERTHGKGLDPWWHHRATSPALNVSPLSFLLWNKLLLKPALVKIFYCLQLITFLADKNWNCTGNS